MLLLSNLKSSSAGAAAIQESEVVKLDYYQTVAALTYLAEFHAALWEAKDENSTVFSLGGFGGDDYPLLGEGGDKPTSGSWGELGEKVRSPGEER